MIQNEERKELSRQRQEQYKQREEKLKKTIHELKQQERSVIEGGQERQEAKNDQERETPEI